MYDCRCIIFDEDAWQDWLWQFRRPCLPWPLTCVDRWGPPHRVRPERPRPERPRPERPRPERPCPPPERPCPERPCPPSEPSCFGPLRERHPAPPCPPWRGEAELCCALPGFCCVNSVQAVVERCCCRGTCLQVWLTMRVSYTDRRGCCHCRSCQACREFPAPHQPGSLRVTVGQWDVTCGCLKACLLLCQS